MPLLLPSAKLELGLTVLPAAAAGEPPDQLFLLAPALLQKAGIQVAARAFCPSPTRRAPPVLRSTLSVSRPQEEYGRNPILQQRVCQKTRSYKKPIIPRP